MKKPSVVLSQVNTTVNINETKNVSKESNKELK